MTSNKEDFIKFYHLTIEKKYENFLNYDKSNAKSLLKFILATLLILVILVPLTLKFLSVGIAVIEISVVGLFLSVYIMKKLSQLGYLTDQSAKVKLLKEQVFSEVVPALLPGFIYKSDSPLTVEKFTNFDFINPEFIHYFDSENAIFGKANDKNITISECKVIQEFKAKDSVEYYQIFSGFVTELDLNIESNFKMIITRKEYRSQGKLHSFVDNVLAKKQLEEISAANVYFDENYKVFTNNAIKTNKILQPKNIEKFINLFQNSDHKISLGVVNSKFIILSETNYDLFEPSKNGTFNPEKIWDGIMGVFDVLKYLEENKMDFNKILS